MVEYRYEVGGVGGDGGTWRVEGSMEIEVPGHFYTLPDKIMREVFGALTQGKAIYGSPGVACRGPYTVDRMLIVRMEA